MRRKRIVKYKPEHIVPIVVGLLEDVTVNILFHAYYLAIRKDLKDLEPYLPEDRIDPDTMILLDHIDDELHCTVRRCMIIAAKCRDSLINLYPGVEITAFQNEEVIALRSDIYHSLLFTDVMAKTYRTCYRRLQKYLISLSSFLHWMAQLILHEELDLSACFHQSFVFGNKSFYLKDHEQHELLLIRMLWQLHHDMTALGQDLHDLAP